MGADVLQEIISPSGKIGGVLSGFDDAKCWTWVRLKGTGLFRLRLLMYRGYFNLLLVISPARLFATIVKANVYHDLLVEWAATAVNRKKQTLLELGCGPGMLALHLASQGHEITAVDLSKAMIAKATKMSQTAGLAVNFRQVDACHTRLPGASFDTVLGASIVNVVKDPLLIMTEARRLLKPNGNISLLFPSRHMSARAIYQFAVRNKFTPFATAVLVTWANNARKMDPDAVSNMLVRQGFSGYHCCEFLDGMVVATTAYKQPTT